MQYQSLESEMDAEILQPLWLDKHISTTLTEEGSPLYPYEAERSMAQEGTVLLSEAFWDG